MENIFIFIYLCFFLVCIIVVISLHLSTKSLLNRILDKFSGLMGMYIAISVILGYLLFKDEVTNIKIKTVLKGTAYAWTDINSKFVEYYDKCPDFVDSLYFDWQKKYILKNKTKRNNNDDWTAVNYLCISIYQAFHYILIISDPEDIEDESWIGSFLNWISSPIVRSYWKVVYIYYPQITQDYINLLINSYEKYPCKNLDEFKKLIKYIMDSEEYDNIRKYVASK